VDLAGAPLRRWRRGADGGRSEDFWALKGVEFDVQAGEVVAVVGRNGAGKSTLLKVLSRITKPTTGRVELHGRVGSLLEVGTGFHPELTGRENIFLNGGILGMKRREIARRFDEIVAFAEVERFLDTPVKRYSSGMYVRLAFAVAAHLEPEILLVDEVLAVGDAEFQKKCLGRMKDISHQGRTVLFVSHNMAAVLSLCKKALLIDQGRVVVEGPTAAIVERYMKDLTSLSGGDVDLTGHPTRRRGSVPLLTRVRFFNESGEATDRVGAGEGLTIALDFNPAVALDQPHFGVCFNDVMGRPVFTVATYFSDYTLPTLTGPRTVYCKIPSLDLVPGTYTIDLSAGTDRDPMDVLFSPVAVEVTATDYFGNGRMPPPDLGPVLVRSDWSADHHNGGRRRPSRPAAAIDLGGATSEVRP
jgi:lipopolysaccharide transport system ATP-binding protein